MITIKNCISFICTLSLFLGSIPVHSNVILVNQSRNIWDGNSAKVDQNSIDERITIELPNHSVAPYLKSFGKISTLNIDTSNRANGSLGLLLGDRSSSFNAALTVGAVTSAALIAARKRLFQPKRILSRIAPVGLGVAAVGGLALAGCSNAQGERRSINIPCSTTLTLENKTRNEVLSVFIDGEFDSTFSPNEIIEICIRSVIENHEIKIYESLSGDLIYTDFIARGAEEAWRIIDPFETEMHVENYTGDLVDIFVDDIFLTTVASGIHAYPVRGAGTHKVRFQDHNVGTVLYDYQDEFFPGLITGFMLSNPACASVIIYNQTVENVLIGFDFTDYGPQRPNDTMRYIVTNGTHHISSVGETSGRNYWTNYFNISCSNYYLQLR